MSLTFVYLYLVLGVCMFWFIHMQKTYYLILLFYTAFPCGALHYNDFSFRHVVYLSNRSELDKLATNSACDVIGLVTFVGRVERVKSKGNKGKKCSCLSIYL